MAADDMGGKQRAWICAGFRYVDSRLIALPVLLAPDDDAPLVLIPARFDDVRREAAFGWAMAELFQQRYGWLGLVRALVHLDEVASFFGALDDVA